MTQVENAEPEDLSKTITSLKKPVVFPQSEPVNTPN